MATGPRPPDTRREEQAIARLYRPLVAALERETDAIARANALRGDKLDSATESAIKAAEGRTTAQARRLTRSTSGRLRAIGDRVVRSSLRWSRRVFAANGVAVAPGVITARSASQRALLRRWEQETARWVEALPQQHWRRVRVRFEQFAGAEAQAKHAREVTGITDRTVTWVGEQQGWGLFTSSAREVQLAAKITRYMWQTQGDSKVRPAHSDRADVVFEWDSPPDGGHPGQAPRCRCWPTLPGS